MQSKIEKKHEEQIKIILKYDFDSYNSIESKRFELIDQRSQYKAELSKLQIVSDRISYFESFLKKLLDSNEITKKQNDAILSYIQVGVDLKWPISDYFNVMTGLLIKLESNFPDGPIWDKFTDVIKQIDLIENELLTPSGNKDKYIKLQEQIISISNLITLSHEKSKIEDEKISKIFSTEDISNVDELNKLCQNIDNKKIELMIIGSKDKVDADLAAVIQMRAKNSSDKGNKLVIMSFDEFEKIIKSDEEVNGVTKLSFLHHGDCQFGYVNKISNYIDHLPNLKEIVLRGCGIAKKTQNNLPVYEVKKVKDSYDNKVSVQGTKQLVIQQKENIEGKTITKVSWRTPDLKEDNKSILHEKRDIENIPLIIEKKPSDTQLTALERIPGIPLLKHEPLYVKGLKNTFFDPNKKISSEELAETKKAVRRARTEPALTQNDLLSKILSKMTPDQKDRVSVKAYVGGYGIHQGRVIPETSHDYDNEPKAVRIGPNLK